MSYRKQNNSIKRFLDERGIDISLENYGRNFFTAFEIKSIIDAPTAIEEMYSAFPLNDVVTIEDYYLYFISKKIITYADSLSSMIHDEHKKIVSKAISLANESLNSITPGMVIKFINDHVEAIFENDSNEYHHVTIDFVADYCKGIDDHVWEYLAGNHGYLLLNRYDDFEKTIENNSKLFDLIFKEGSLSEIESLRLESVLDVWCHIYRKEHSNLKEKVEALYRSLHRDMLSIANEATVDNVMIIERKISRFYDFLKKIRSPLANDFSHVKKQIDAVLEKSIIEGGHVYKYELPVKEMIDRWKSTEHWELRLLSLTHDRKINENSIDMVSRMSADYNSKSSFIDMVNTNVPTDNFFNLSRQQGLSLLADVLGATIIGIISNQKILQDYISQIVSAISYISDKIDDGTEHLAEDSQYLVNQIIMISSNLQETEIVKTLTYGASMYAVALAEKLLRLFYISLVRDEIYVPSNKATMGELLTINNTHITEIFGDTHVRCLSFFLIQTSDSKIGHNIRNSLAHWNDISSNSMNIRFLSRCLWLFTDIMNTIFWYFLKNDNNL